MLMCAGAGGVTGRGWWVRNQHVKKDLQPAIKIRAIYFLILLKSKLRVHTLWTFRIPHVRAKCSSVSCIPEIRFVLLGRSEVSSAPLMNTRILSRKKRRYRCLPYTTLFKKRPNFLNSAPTSTESEVWLLSATSVRFWQQTAICPVSLWALIVELHPLNWARAQAVRRITNFALTRRIWSFWVKKIWWRDPMLVTASSATSRTVKADARCA
jgi:hypothetical protein